MGDVTKKYISWSLSKITINLACIYLLLFAFELWGTVVLFRKRKIYNEKFEEPHGLEISNL